MNPPSVAQQMLKFTNDNSGIFENRVEPGRQLLQVMMTDKSANKSQPLSFNRGRQDELRFRNCTDVVAPLDHDVSG